MKVSKEVSSFQQRCHQYFTCFTFATMGLQSIAQKFRSRIAESLDPSLFIGSGPPDGGQAHSQIKLKDAVQFSEKNGAFSDMLAKSMIISIYSEWDELYRHKVGAEAGVHTHAM